MTLLLVAAGGAAGAVLRYLADRWLSSDVIRFPRATLLVNLAGSAGLGALAGAAAGPSWVDPLLATGLFGALTTYSTFGYETARLFADGRTLAAVGNVLVTLVGGVGAAALGWNLAAG